MLRDNYNIIIQPNFNDDGTIKEGSWDEGDSSFSTGLSAFGGSDEDFQLMPKFIKNGKLVRHPYSEKNTGTAPHNDPAATSRDQVLAFFSGLYVDKNPFSHYMVSLACLNYARSWKINGDFNSPANRLYLYKIYFKHYLGSPPLWISIVGRINLAIDLLWNCFGNPKHEMNQSLVANAIFGKHCLWFLNKFHPDLDKNILSYFEGWRTRKPIAVGMIERKNQILKIKPAKG